MNATASETGEVLVIGGQGKTGSRVVRRLQARGVPVRSGSRSSRPPFDWTAPGTWPDAVAGAAGLYITYFPDLALPGAAEAVEALARVAGEAGVDRIALLSGRGEAGAQRAEDLLWKAAPSATVVRCSWFCQNFSESFMAEGLLAGELILPAGDIPEPFVDAEDIADVATAALLEPGHQGKLYELTGPRAITFAEAVTQIARAAGRAIAYRQVSLEDFLTDLEAQDVPQEVRAMLEFLFGEVLDGRNASPADGVQRALGRPATTFEAFARRAAADGAWRLAAE